MSGIMVFLPGYAGDERDELARRGLADLFDNTVSTIFSPVAKGPDGGPGKHVIFYSQFLPDTPRCYEPALQEWKPAPKSGDLESGRYWLGYVRGAKPEPGELVRREVCDGEPVILRDGNSWTVPIADFMPKRLTIDADGREVREVADRHREFVFLSDRIFALLLESGYEVEGEHGPAIEIPGGLTFAALALSKNYRVNRDAVDLLELIEDLEAFKVAAVVTGMAPALRAIAEKKNLELSFL